MGQISVIIAVYNGQRTLEKAISSVLEQSYRDFELILVDDGSEDDSGALCDDAAKRDARVRVIHQKNRGVAAARNAGLAAAKCPYITWLDSDDYFEPGMLETMMSRVSLPGVQAAVCNYRNVSEKGVPTTRYKLDAEQCVDGLSMVKLMVANRISPVLWGNVMERSLYDGVSFCEGRLYEDVESVWKLFLKCEKVMIVNAVLYTRVLHADSITRIKLLANRVESLEVYLERQDRVRELDPEMDKLFYYNYAQLLQLLRIYVYRDSRENYRAFRSRIVAICRRFRAHTADAMSGPGADALVRLEYFLLTAGNLAGFYASSAVYQLRTRLLHLRSPILR